MVNTREKLGLRNKGLFYDVGAYFLSCKEQMAHIQDMHAKYVLKKVLYKKCIYFFIVIDLPYQKVLSYEPSRPQSSMQHSILMR